MKSSFVTFLFLLSQLASQWPSLSYGKNSPKIKLQSKTTINAGDGLNVKISGSYAKARCNAPTLTVSDSHGIVLIKKLAMKTPLSVKLKRNTTQVSGVLHIELLCGIRLATKNVTVRSVSPTSPLLFVVGPKTTKTSHKSDVVVTALPIDRFTNPIDDRKEISFKYRDTDGKKYQLNAETKHLIAWKRIPGALKSGSAAVAATTGKTYDFETKFSRIPAAPNEIRTMLIDSPSVSDGNNLIRIKTNEIRDKYGNTLSDGVYGEFQIFRGQKYYGTSSGVINNGVLKTLLRAPDRKLNLNVRATVLDTISNSVLLPYPTAPDSNAFQLKIDKSINQITKISAGPILGDINQLVSDNTAVDFELYRSKRLLRKGKARTKNGFAVWNKVYSSKESYGQFMILVKVGDKSQALNFYLGKK